MKKTCYLLLTCTWLLTTSHTGDRPPLEIGAPIPKADAALRDISGKEISLNNAKGRNGLLVMFSGNRCPYVIRNQARTRNICKYALKNQIGVVLINSNAALHSGEESPEAMKAYARAQQYEWYYVIDRKAVIADAFEANHTPECYLFDNKGRLAYKGAIDDNPGHAAEAKTAHLHNAIAALLAGQPVKVSTTAAPGCNIKRF
jgi:cytochrome oxidase Cu insertion factor (SCO1/SenC/PrrC family)